MKLYKKFNRATIEERRRELKEYSIENHIEWDREEWRARILKGYSWPTGLWNLAFNFRQPTFNIIRCVAGSGLIMLTGAGSSNPYVMLGSFFTGIFVGIPSAACLRFLDNSHYPDWREPNYCRKLTNSP